MNIKIFESYSQELLQTKIDSYKRTSLALTFRHNWIKFMTEYKPKNLNKLSSH